MPRTTLHGQRSQLQLAGHSYPGNSQRAREAIQAQLSEKHNLNQLKSHDPPLSIYLSNIVLSVRQRYKGQRPKNGKVEDVGTKPGACCSSCGQKFRQPDIPLTFHSHHSNTGYHRPNLSCFQTKHTASHLSHTAHITKRCSRPTTPTPRSVVRPLK